MLTRAKRLASSPAKEQGKSLAFLVETTGTLDGLMEMAESEQLQEQRDLMIAEAAAHCYYWSRTDHKLYNNSNTMVALRSQNTLCGAIVLGDLPLVQALLRDRTDIDVNVESACFGLPLHLAAAWGHVAIFQHLLESGAAPCGLSHDAKEDPRWYYKQDNHSPRGSALRAAAGAGYGEIVQFLLSLSAGCQIPATSPEYRHALFSAAQGGYIGCIKLLLRATGRPLAEFADEHDELREKMLCAAARGGHIDVRGAQLGILAWLVARYGGEIAATESCPDDPWDPENHDTIGQVALMMAIVDPAPDVILRFIREAGATKAVGKFYRNMILGNPDITDLCVF